MRQNNNWNSYNAPVVLESWTFVNGYSAFLNPTPLRHKHSLLMREGKKEGSKGGGKRIFSVMQMANIRERSIREKKGWRNHHASLVLRLAELLWLIDSANSWAVSCAALHCLFAWKLFCCGLGSHVWHTSSVGWALFPDILPPPQPLQWTMKYS